MKKTILLIIGFMSVACSSDDNKIDTSIRDSLVDYVNCEYVKTYCEYEKNLHKSDSVLPEDIIKYDKYIYPKIYENSIQHPVTKETLSQSLKDNGWENTNKKLVEVINKNKNSESCIDSIVSIARLSPDFRNILKSKESDLKLELQEYKQRNVDSEQKSISVGMLIILLVAGLFVIFVIVMMIHSNKDKKDNKKRKEMGKTESDKYKKLEIAYNKLGKENNDLLKKNSELEDEIRELKNKIDTQKRPLQPIQQTNPNPIYTTSAPTPPVVKYLKTAKNGVFYNMFDSQDDCQFKVFDIVGNKANFEFCGDSEFGIANENALFDNVCELYGCASSLAHHIKNEKPGALESMGNGQWKVIEKAQIKFEE